MKNLDLIAEILDSTFDHPSKSGTYSLNYSLDGDRLQLKYSTIVHFASEQSLQTQLGSLRERSMQLIDEGISKLKKNYRDKSDSTLKIKDMGGTDDIELISATSNSPRKVAYFRCNRVLQLTV